MQSFPALDFDLACELFASLLSLPEIDIVTHRNPDADTLGCALALASALTDAGVGAAVKCADKPPRHLAFLTDGFDIDAYPRGCPAVAVDIASREQMGELYDRCRDSLVLSLDHHGGADRFAPTYCEPSAAACGEIIFLILDRIAENGGIKAMSEDTLTYIYAAVSGDTGSFRFGNTTQRTHRIAASLIERGARAEWCAHRLHAVKTIAEMKAEALAYANMRVSYGGKLAFTTASAGELASAGLCSSDFSTAADKMRCLDGVLAGMSIREAEDGSFRVSMRSNVPVSCAAAASAFGGGGHLQAAGCTIHADDMISAAALAEKQLVSQIMIYEEGLK